MASSGLTNLAPESTSSSEKEALSGKILGGNDSATVDSTEIPHTSTDKYIPGSRDGIQETSNISPSGTDTQTNTSHGESTGSNPEGPANDSSTTIPVESKQGAQGDEQLGPATKTQEANAANSLSRTQSQDAAIDSALLSALSDQRERVGLLRLEQTLIEFMKDKSTGYIEVGGAFNSVVIGGKNGNNPGGDGNGGRQTSFHRLCLHRLADRFNIVRESPASSTGQHTGVRTDGTSDGGGFYQQRSVNPNAYNFYPPGLIRLVKVKGSRTPDVLLIDLDWSQTGGRQQLNARTGSFRGEEDTDETSSGVNGMVHSMSTSSLSDGQQRTATTSERKSPKKMMIMKRSSSNLSSGSLKGKDGSSKGGRTNAKANITDREKAYAEARARIFNESLKNGSSHSVDDSDHQDNSRSMDSDGRISSVNTQESSIGDVVVSISTPASSNPSPSTTPPPCPSIPVSSPSSPRTSESGTATSNEKVQNCDMQSNYGMPVADDSLKGGKPRSLTSPNKQNSSTCLVPAAATGGAIRKVTWRNRRQEESDPDFRRRTTVRVPHMVTGTGVLPDNVVVGPMHAGASPYSTPVGIPFHPSSSTESPTGSSTLPVASEEQRHLHQDSYSSMPTLPQTVPPGAMGNRGYGQLYHNAPNFHPQQFYQSPASQSSGSHGQSHNASGNGGPGGVQQGASWNQQQQSAAYYSQQQQAQAHATYYGQQHQYAPSRKEWSGTGFDGRYGSGGRGSYKYDGMGRGRGGGPGTQRGRGTATVATAGGESIVPSMDDFPALR